MSTNLEENKLTLTRTFAASPERVFAAWTKPEQIRGWFGRDGMKILGINVDLRIGGAYSITVCSEQYGEMTVSGEYREVMPCTKLSYTWLWEDDPAYVNHATLVTVEFLGKGDTTEVRLTHENFPTVENCQNHESGWQGGMAKLEQYLAA